jgi:hypothetical protein
MLCPGRHTRPGNYPVLQETVLGRTVAGKTPAVTTNQELHQTLFCRDDVNSDQQLQRFWTLESCEQPILSPQHTSCEQHFTKMLHDKMMVDLL